MPNFGKEENGAVVDAVELEENDAWLIAEIEENLGGPDENQMEDADHVSFEDSERFEEDSLCSLPSENGSLNHKWRGWAPRNSLSFSNSDQPETSGRAVGTSAALSGAETLASFSKNFDHLSASCSTAAFGNTTVGGSVFGAASSRLRRLEYFAARKVAQAMSFEAVECTCRLLESNYESFRVSPGKIPEYLFKLILRQCFPDSEKDIRLYSCLANTHSNRYSEGERLYQAGAVGEIFQIGYHVSAVVRCFGELKAADSSNFRTSYGNKYGNGSKYYDSKKYSDLGNTINNNKNAESRYDVSIRVDKCRIVSCKCSCSPSSSWCQHIVAVCLQRIHQPDSVQFRMTIWDSITSLAEPQVKKLAQYLINELPREYLPVAQKLIDELQNSQSEINKYMGAPDPTVDGHDDGIAAGLWCMNEKVLHENIYKILTNFVRPAPTVHCDVQYLSSTSPPASNEWNVLIRPLRSKEPEALWNLLSIVREMLKRGDENASTLLHIITVDCLRLSQLASWWYQTSLSRSGYWQLPNQKGHTLQAQVSTTQHNAASLCDEIVDLWRLIALNPKLTLSERDQLSTLLQTYHRSAVSRIWKRIETNVMDSYYSLNIVDANGAHLSTANASFTERLFPGFFPALQACHMNWSCAEIGRVVNELKFVRIKKIIQDSFGTCSTSIQPCQSPHEFHNIPLLLYGLDTLLADVEKSEHAILTVSAAGGVVVFNSFDAQPKSSRARQKRQKARRHQRQQQRKSNRDRQKQQQQPRAINSLRLGCAENNAESDDSLPEDVEEDLEDAPSTSQQVVKNKKSLHSRREPFMDELEAFFALAHSEIDGFDARFVCCEALLSHGYVAEAFVLARRLAKELLKNPPNLIFDSASDKFTALMENVQSTSDANVTQKSTSMKKPTCRHNKRGSTCDFCASLTNDIGPSSSSKATVRRFIPPTNARLDSSQLAVSTFSYAIYFVRILISFASGGGNSSKVYDSDQRVDAQTDDSIESSHCLAVELALRVLRNPRGPAATKSLEVHIYHLEHELLSLLHKIAVTPKLLALVRNFAINYLRELKSVPTNRIIVPPLSMAQYILDALSGKFNANSAASVAHGNRRTFGLNSNFLHASSTQKFVELSSNNPDDDKLALAVALETLGMRVFVHEADHPMLCECIRRQRGDLSLTLFLQNRDSVERLAIILDKVLDPAVHQMYNTNSNAVFFLSQLDSRNYTTRNTTSNLVAEILSATQNEMVSKIAASENNKNEKIHFQNSTDSVDSDKSCLPIRKSSASGDTVVVRHPLNSDSASSSGMLNGDEFASGLSSNSNSSGGGLSLEGKRTSNSSTSSGGFTSIVAAFEQQPSQILSNLATEAQAHFMVELAKRLLTEAGGNQSTTMFISLNNAAAGPNGQPVNGGGANGSGGSHRNLHICSFLTGLYALGLNNLVSSTWPTRTYSTHVSWIQTQALEIGRSALQIVRETWESHLTPTEVASLADKASQSTDPAMVEQGAFLALSVLPKAFALTAIESQKALNQCKEQSPKLLEGACIAVERAAEKDGVYPEVLFKVAHHWFNLYIENARQESFTNDHLSNDMNLALVNSSSANFTARHLQSSQQQQHIGASSIVAQQNFTNTGVNLIPASYSQQHHSYHQQPPPQQMIRPLLSLANQSINYCSPSNYSNQQPQTINNNMPYSHTHMFQTPASSSAHVSAADLVAAKTQAMIDQVVQQHHPRHNLRQQPQLQPHPQAQQQLQQQQHAPNLPSAYAMRNQPLAYSNAYPYSSNTLINACNVPLSLTHQQMHAQHGMSPDTSASGRLHVSHSAPNLQPTGASISNGHFSLQIPPPMPSMGMPPAQILPPPPQLMSQQLAPPNAYSSNGAWNNIGTVSMPAAAHAINSPATPFQHINNTGSFHQQPQQSQQQIFQMPTTTNNGNNLPQQQISLNLPPTAPHNNPPVQITNSYPNQSSSHPSNVAPSSVAVLPHQQQPILQPMMLPPPPLTVAPSHHSVYVNPPIPPTSLVVKTAPQKPLLPRFLINAHRVGMRAMDTMGQRNSDDNRSFSKYSRTPTFGDDIRWLFEEVSVKLGDAYVHSFCEKACACIASPFLIFQLVKECVNYFKLTMPQMPSSMYSVYMPSSSSATVTSAVSDQPPGAIHHTQMNAVKSCAAQAKYLMIVQQMYPPSVADLLRHCVEMCYMAAFNKLNHSRFNEADIEDTCELVLTARQVFAMVPQPHCRAMFDAFIRFVRKQKACKKEPIQRINSVLHPTPHVLADN